MNLKDIYWAAGFIDGEGWIRRPATIMGATQRDPELLYRLQKLFGGRVYVRPHQHTSFGDNAMWEWYVCGPTARGLMMTLFPLFSAKRKEQVKDSLTRWRNRKSYPPYSSYRGIKWSNGSRQAA